MLVLCLTNSVLSVSSSLFGQSCNTPSPDRSNWSDWLGIFKPSSIIFHPYLFHSALSFFFLQTEPSWARSPPPPPFDFLPLVAPLRFLTHRSSPPPPPPSPNSNLASPRPSRRESKLQASMDSSSAPHRRSDCPVVLRPNKSPKWVRGELLILPDPFLRGFRRRNAAAHRRHGLVDHDRSNRLL